MEMSNRTIAILLIATIVVYLGGTFISLNRLAGYEYTPTGLATDDQSGNVSVTIASTTSITWVISAIHWGSGYVNTSCNNCTMQVNSTDSLGGTSETFDDSCCLGNFNKTNESLLLRNNGNVDVSLMMNISSNHTDWFGTDTPAAFQFKIVDEYTREHDDTDLSDTALACAGNSTDDDGWYAYEGETWVDLDSWTGPPRYICGDDDAGYNFTYIGTKNEANFDFKIVIPRAYTTGTTVTKSTFIRILATS